MAKQLTIGVLASGSGTNFQSIIDAVEGGDLDATIAVLISNNPQSYAIERAKKHSIAVEILDHRNFSSRGHFDQRMVDLLRDYGVELVVMAGFMRILSPLFLRAFPHRIMNIHPALLPSFPGLNAQKQAFDYGVKFSGCTVHFADEGVDTGPIIIQAVVPVLDDDTEESLQKRILQEEHRIYPRAIKLYAEERLEITGRKVRTLSYPKPRIEARHNPPLPASGE